MSPRLYLRLLHPWGVLLMGGLYVLGGTFISAGFVPAEHRSVALLACGVIAPLVLGHILAATAHEQINRPEILLLPEGLARMRRASIWATLTAALSLTALLAWFAPAVPCCAAFGLIAGLLTLQYPNRYRRAMGALWPVGIFAAWAIFVRTSVAQLQPAMIAAPGVFFAGGLALAATGLGWGFARRHLRERSETVYPPLAHHNLAVIFDHAVLRRMVQQNAARAARAGKLKVLSGADWKVRRVEADGWGQVLWHAGLAGLPTSSFVIRHGKLLLGALAACLLVPLLAIPVERLLDERAATTLADYWTQVVHYADPYAWLRTKNAPGIGFAAFIVVFGQPWLAMLTTLMTPLPQLYYPISRRHLARVVFFLSLRQIATALILSNGCLILVSLLGQAVRGEELPLSGYSGLISVSLVLAIALPALLCMQFLGSSGARLAVGVPGVLLVGLAGADPMFWPGHLLTPGLLPLALLGGLASVALLRWRIQVRYCRHDLFGEPHVLQTRVL